MKIPFKVKKIADYKMCLEMDERLLKFVDDNFILSEVTVKPLNNNALMVVDKFNKSLVFTMKDGQVDYYEPEFQLINLVQEETELNMEP